MSAFNTVLAVFETERNMYYRHKAALMYDQRALLLSFTFAELPFILLVSVVFVVLFYFIMGFAMNAEKFFMFYLFFTLSQMVFTFMGQMFSSLMRDSMTAQGVGGLFVSLTVLFTGVLIRPSQIPDPWIFMYCKSKLVCKLGKARPTSPFFSLMFMAPLTHFDRLLYFNRHISRVGISPGHYIYEGLMMTQFRDDDTEIIAAPGSPFYNSLGCTPNPDPSSCTGTAEDWVNVSFGPDFSYSHVPYNLVYLLGLILFSRFVTYLALTHLNYRST